MTTIYTTKPLPERRDADHYPTPLGFCRAAIRWLDPAQPFTYVLDPGCGGGVWGRAVTEHFPQRKYIYGIDIRPVGLPPGYWRFHQADFLADDGRGLEPPFAYSYGLIVGNPPYDQAEAFVRKSLGLLAPHGNLLFLLRLAFLEGQARGAGLFADFPPVKVGVVSKRISFSGNKKTNATAYALYHWQEGYHGPTRLDWMTFDYDPEDVTPTGGKKDES